MQVESETTVDCPAAEVFDYIAHAEYLPEYVSDFDTVQQVSAGEPGVGTQYSYTMKRGNSEGTFEWTRFEPASHLAWHGPRVKAGPGSMEPAGWWDLSPAGTSTRVKLVMAPEPGGLFKLLSPFLAAGMRKGNAQALERLKQNLESRPAPPPAPPGS
jgi:uncharacterized protein YndB with AHSA1/START domain